MPAATPDTREVRAARYRKRAAELRLLAEKVAANNVNREQLLSLAEDFEELADSLGQTPLGN
jgi:hypothetical protein